MRIFRIIFIGIVFCLLNFGVSADNGTAWIRHQSFDRQPVKIMDGERFTYFMTHSELYDTQIAGHDQPIPSLFRFDKSNSLFDNGFIHGYHDGETVVAAAGYNPYRKYLAVVYGSGVMTLIYDSGLTRTHSTLKDTEFSTSKNINSLSFDPDDDLIHIAGEFGYVALNEKTGDISDRVSSDVPVLWSGRVGGSIVLFSSTDAYIKNRNVRTARLEDMNSLEFAGENLPAKVFKDRKLVSPKLLMPLRGEAFVFLTATATNSADHYINLGYKKDGEWHYSKLGDIRLSLVDKKQQMRNGYESAVMPDRDGYLIISADSYIQVRRDTDISSLSGTDFATNLLDSASGRSDAVSGCCGSYDFSSFWFYKTRQGFVRAKLNGNEWVDTGTPALPNCPSAFICDYMKYNPTHGLIVSNHGCSEFFQNYNASVPLLVDGLKGDVWTHYSPVYNFSPVMVGSVMDFGTFQAQYGDRFPIIKSRGLTFDPNHPDHAYFSSFLNGIVRVDLAKPDSPVLHFSRANDPMADKPGFIGFAPVLNGMANLCCFSNPEFDYDGNLWALYYNLDSGVKNELWVLQKDLLERFNAGAEADLTSWVKLPLAGAGTGTGFSRIFTPKHSDSRNIVIAMPNHVNSPIVVYDHRGTLSDASDDRMVMLCSLTDQNGMRCSLERVHAVMEDTESGDVWIGYDEGVFCFNPGEVMADPAHVKSPVVNGGKYMSGDRFLSGIEVISMCEDMYGRKWFGTDGAGVWALDAAGKNVIAHYDANNSPMPSSTVYGLCSDPEKQSLMISTKNGLVEFFPEMEGLTSARSEVVVYPAVVCPDYYGDIYISGIDPGESVVVSSSAGDVVRNATLDPDGRFVVKNVVGDRLATDRYTVGNKSGKTFGEIIVLN